MLRVLRALDSLNLSFRLFSFLLINMLLVGLLLVVCVEVPLSLSVVAEIDLWLLSIVNHVALKESFIGYCVFVDEDVFH
jgi:hypothetical protein